MTFKHKLSVRLALIRNAATAFAAVAIFGCAGDFAVAPEQPLFDVAAPQILFQESFEDAAFASRAWYDNTAMTTTTAQHIPGSTRALEARFLAGATNPTWGGAARHLFPVTPTLYVSYWVKYSPNWVGSARAYHPHELLVLSDQDGDWDGPSNNWLTAYIEHNYQNGGIPRLALQDNKAINTGLGALPNNLTAVTESRSVSGCNGVVELNVVATCFNMPPWYNGKEFSAPQVWFQPNAGPGYKGDWNHVEVYFQVNSVVGGLGLPDGVMQYWFNGAPVIDRHDILYRTGARPTIQFRQFMIAPYIGDGSPVDQTMWIDDLIVATGKPAAPAPPPPPPPAADTSVKSVSVGPASASVAVGATRQLAATLKDVNGGTLTGRTVTWASGAPAVATVSATGLVKAVTTGSATITATSEGITGTAVITVTAVKPSAVADLAVASVTDHSVTLSFTEVNDGTGRPASYQVRFKAGTLSWGSGTDVANGTCKAPVSGTAIGAKRTCTVLGLAPVKAYQFQLVAFHGTLNVNAVFGALSNKVSATTTAKPPAPVAPVASVTVSPASGSLTVGATQQLSATLKDALGNTLTGRTITWASSTPAVATVNGSGLVTALAAGSATITVTSEGKIGSATITVTDPVVTNPGTVNDLAVASVTDNSVTLSFSEVTGGADLPASYDVRYAVSPISWGSAAAVTTGTCQVVMTGTTIGAKRTCTVLGLAGATAYQFQLVAFRGTLNVDAVFGSLSNIASGTTGSSVAAVATITLSPATGSVSVLQTLQLTATLRDASGNVLTGRAITWTSGAPLLAGVSGSGLVSGLVAGLAPITATSEGQSASASITVTTLPSPPPPPPPPGGGFTHEPSGFTVIQDMTWENGLLGSWFRKFTSASKPITIVPITDSPLGEGQALQIGFNAGHVGGGGTELEYDIPSALQPREMFVGYYVQVSSNWQGHNSAINKMVYLDDGGSSFSAMWYEMFGSGSSPLSLYVVNQSGGSPAGIHENGAAVNFTRGVWHKVEIYQTQGSPGIIRVWVDGILAIDRSDVYTKDAAIGMVTISGIWGGIDDVKQHFDYMRFDNIRISGR